MDKNLKSYKPKLFLWIKQQETMSLQQLCSSSGNKRISSSNAPFIPPTIQTQEVYDAKFSQQPMERCASQTSTLSFSRDICRICHCEGDSETPLIAPCYCAGSLRYVHQGCLQQWIKSSDTKCCELCKFPFIMHSKVKTFRKWERLDMSGVERRKIMFSVLFHIIAITCVVWSLYVLIERTSQEVQNGELEWPFWTKLIVVAIGFTGSIVFMYVQCKMYIHLCRRWRAFNRVIYIQNAPEKIILDEVEMSKLQADFQSEAQKPFLALAVITSTSGTTVINTSGTGIINTSHGGCCTTSSSPPGALWSEETSPQLTTLSCYNSEISNHHCRPEEGDSLISRTEPPSRSDARTKPVYDSTRRWFKETRQGSPRRNFRKSREKPLPSVTSSLGLSRNVQQEQAIAALSSSESSDAETPQLDGP